MRHLALAIISVALRLALVGCGHDHKSRDKTSTSTSTTTPKAPSSRTSAAPAAKAKYTIADYVRDTTSPRRPCTTAIRANVDLPVPAGWQLNQNCGTSYGGIVQTQPADGRHHYHRRPDHHHRLNADGAAAETDELRGLPASLGRGARLALR